MASSERSGRLVRIVVLALMLLPIHTLPLLAAEQVAKPVVEKAEPQEKSVVKKLVGIASYYAKKFHGRATTSGERYHPEKMTAAHQSLPLGTKVLVRNLANDKEVTVVINDRCRKKGFPFIDLSRAAARKLGFLGEGKAKVAIIPLTEDES
ncbi:septal ring lytic transglycosylase RlpA family protein [Geomonas sp. Red69]|uniref:Probable endolytic peptidoglycan transglycosylase RlpA n=1 Tax=Geomonas diazotrophica TaxID=2843197 RepID=A0ABX8JK98_9BACT|nr:MULTISPECIES: septal ring lytic transglycosylase RlpA family protein [Geomonas]MBU5635706.1 septal ring lytic transglycosylase RlpA family protein [Geomonas diazotrophica]QWV98054.1 septal ring lytic transglycosylase RlpA family protein [Geomonas nitrogeniifigens]QXE87186.1 septal ring lytic transglycosylase RlpA family protein [Geomonas nitrogeniifigens]